MYFAAGEYIPSPAFEGQDHLASLKEQLSYLCAVKKKLFY